MGQTLAQWEQELTEAIELVSGGQNTKSSLGHLSLYQLTIERGTAFYHAHKKGRIILPDEDVSADMYQLTQEICQSYGLPAYEVSNHARFGEESRHNLTYWTYGDYIGIGPGSHGRLSIEGQLFALSQDRSPEKWLTNVQTNGHATDHQEALTVQMKAEEMIMMGLRLNRGIDLGSFEARIGQKIENFIDRPYLERLFELGYMEKDGHHLRATAEGMPLLNSLLGRLLT